MKIAILGYDIEGRASYDYLSAQGHKLVIHDQNPDVSVPDGVASVLGETYLDNLDQYDYVVRTAGLPPPKIFAANPGIGLKITSHLNLFIENCPTRNIIGITGTKGKGTTSTLVAKMLEVAGLDVRLGGNIGLPPLTFIDQLTTESWVVLELSSFQLTDLRTSPHIAVCLMVVPEHLNWHADMADYVGAKTQLFANQTAGDIAISYADSPLSRQIASASPGKQLPYCAEPGAYVAADGSITIDNQTICSTDDLRLLGAHNWQNACAAVTTVWQVTQEVAAIKSVLTTCTGLPHRLELVRTLNNVSYYDDSFGTTPETAIVAMQAFTAPKVVIIGGSDKGASYDELAEAVASSNIRKVLLIGEQADRIQAAFDAAGFNNYTAGGSTMPEIVATAHAIAEAGDVVLLSTACASFDMFTDYKDRGQQFSAAVQALV